MRLLFILSRQMALNSFQFNKIRIILFSILVLFSLPVFAKKTHSKELNLTCINEAKDWKSVFKINTKKPSVILVSSTDLDTKEEWFENLSLKILDSNKNRIITLDSSGFDEELLDDQYIFVDIFNLNSGKLLSNGIYPNADSPYLDIFNCRDSSTYISEPVDEPTPLWNR